VLPTRFPQAASGPAERIVGFIAHLRMNGLKAGPREARDALEALNTVDAADTSQTRLALKTLLATDADTWRKFDELVNWSRPAPTI